MAAQLGSAAARRSSGGKRPDAPAVVVVGLGERLGAEQLERAGERVAERLGVEADPLPRALEQVAAALDLRLAAPPGARAPPRAPRRRCCLRSRVEVGRLDLAREALDVAVADAALEAALDVVVDDLREAAELLLDRLGLADEHLEHAVLGALRQTK